MTGREAAEEAAGALEEDDFFAAGADEDEDEDAVDEAPPVEAERRPKIGKRPKASANGPKRARRPEAG